MDLVIGDILGTPSLALSSNISSHVNSEHIDPRLEALFAEVNFDVLGGVKEYEENQQHAKDVKGDFSEIWDDIIKLTEENEKQLLLQ